MRYTSILFDLDGTLLDTLADLTAAMNRTLTRHGLPERTRKQMRTALGNGARRLMELSVPAGTDSALFETLLAEYNADYAAHCRIETAPYPGVAALLLKLHAQGRKLAIVSNKPDEAVRAASGRITTSFRRIWTHRSCSSRHSTRTSAMKTRQRSQSTPMPPARRSRPRRWSSACSRLRSLTPGCGRRIWCTRNRRRPDHGLRKGIAPAARAVGR